MNILFLSELFYPHGSGAELATYLYARNLSNEGINVCIVTNRFNGEPSVCKQGNLIVYRLPLLKGGGSVKYAILKRFDLLISTFFKRLIKWADVVYVPRLWFSAIPLAKKYGKPVFTHLHDYIPICPLSNFYDVSKHAECSRHTLFCPPRCIYFYERTHGRQLAETVTSTLLNSTLNQYVHHFLKLSDVIICVSKVQKDIINAEIPAFRPKIKVIYNLLPDFSQEDIEGDDFGYFGGPNRLKGFQILYQALRHINKMNIKIPNMHATKFAIFSKKLTASLKNLRFVLYGKLNNDKYNELYRHIRSVVVPSIWNEPWPYVIVEAIIKKRFIIASSIGGIPEQLEGCKGAILYKPGDAKALAESITLVSDLSKEAIIDLGSKNKETFLKRFNNKKTMKSFVSICENLI